MLAWAAEVAQLDIAAGLALALLALIAVLPEYAVDFVFTWKGGQAVAAVRRLVSQRRARPRVAVFARAREHDRREPIADRHRVELGGVHRVVPVAPARSDGRPPRPVSEIRLARTHAVEIAFLAVATLYSLTLPLKHSITLIDAGVLIGLFVLYIVAARRARLPRSRTWSARRVGLARSRTGDDG